MKKIIRLVFWTGVGLMVAFKPLIAEVTSTDPRELSCQQFIQQVLKQDPDFMQSLQQYLKITYQKLSAQAIADWTLGSGLNWIHSESTDTSGVQPAKIDTLSYYLTLEKLFLGSGTIITLEHHNNLNQFDYGIGGPLQLDFGSGPVAIFDQPNESSLPQLKVSFVQPLLRNAFGLASRFPLEQARLQAQAAQLDVQEAFENRLMYLFNSYMDWQAAYEQVAALQAIVLDIEKLEKIVAEKAQAGVVERTELLRTRDNLLRHRALIAQAQATLFNHGLRVHYLQYGRMSKTNQSIGMPSKSQQLPECPVTEQSLAKLDVSQFRLMKKMILLQQQQEASLVLAANSALPSLDVIGELGIKGRADDLSGGLSHLDEKTDYLLGLQASYPLGSSRATSDEQLAQAGLLEIASSMAATKRELELGAAQLAETIKRTEEVVNLEKAKLANAKEKLVLDEKNYRIGRLDTFYLIDAQNALTNAHLQLVNTTIMLKKYRIQFLALTDQLLPLFPELNEQLNDQ